MSAVVCSDHGEQVSTLLSPELVLFISGKSIPQSILRVSEVVDGSEDWGQRYLATENELSAFGVTANNQISEEYLDSYDQFISSLTPICSLCVLEFIDKLGAPVAAFRLEIQD